MDNITSLVSGALKRERVRQRISQSVLEDYSGIPKARISRYENAHVCPSVHTLVRLCDGLGVTVGQLLTRAGL